LSLFLHGLNQSCWTFILFFCHAILWKWTHWVIWAFFWIMPPLATFITLDHWYVSPNILSFVHFGLQQMEVELIILIHNRSMGNSTKWNFISKHLFDMWLLINVTWAYLLEQWCVWMVILRSLSCFLPFLFNFVTTSSKVFLFIFHLLFQFRQQFNSNMLHY
jgi:hypothetical protein